MEDKVVIEVKDLTKDYGNNKGIFHENFVIHQGEMVGFVGTNGSGKTTTIRSILGFITPSEGNTFVEGRNSRYESPEILKRVGYVPGEISFPDLGTGTNFLHSQAEMLGVKNFDYANSLIEKLQLDPSANLKRMSKGMKQKTALVAALMQNPDILILDEPTTGLDPLMRESFISIIEEEHKKGKTILMSSHMFEEVEETCDSVILINDGHIIDHVAMNDIRHPAKREYKIEFLNKEDYEAFQKLPYQITCLQDQYYQVTVLLKKDEINQLFESLKGKKLHFISENRYTLQKHFLAKLKELSEKEKQ